MLYFQASCDQVTGRLLLEPGLSPAGPHQVRPLENINLCD